MAFEHSARSAFPQEFPGLSVAVEGKDNDHSRAGGLLLDPSGCWERVRSRLRGELGEQVFTSWFGRMDFEGFGDGTVYLSVPTRFLKTWIQQNYRDRLLGHWGDEIAEVRRVEVAVRGSTVTQKAAAPCSAALVAEPSPRGAAPSPSGRVYVETEPRKEVAEARRRAAESAPEDAIGSPLDKRLTFETFMVGRSNELAHKAALRVATAPDGVPFNPLYIHAAVGLGKTHLLHALARAARNGGRHVLYLTAERFMYGFVAALKAQSAIAFKEQLRGIDILLIDDLQFLQGKHVQAEFGHTLNALLDGSRQVVVAADRTPSDIETIDERLQSRLAGGLVVEITPPDVELRLKILKSKFALARERYANLDIPEQVLAYVARVVQSSARDLDGAFNRLLAHNQFTQAPLTVEMAEEYLKDLIKVREPKRVKIEDIQRITAKHYNVSRQDMLSERRTRNVVLPRQVAMYLAKTLTPRSLPEIGRRFGGRDHTTVLHAVRKIDELLAGDARLAQDVELLKRLLLDA